uniref:NADH dehydrogenase subunit 3 n=1 Tax=Augilodes binghami TaxID=2886263 RepID=UPI001E72AF47|nr:NADH dehydrogenase subunit 3 [Augilodes binghami]UDL72051.1 NADH dehydrogenase subunit 3 [Augilodes binghami]
MKIIFTFSTILILTFTFFILTTFMSKKSKINRNKNLPFECGFESFSSPRNSFSTHFFLIATIFLIFDVEISIILPLYSTKISILKEWLIFSFLILLILMMGLIHEWKNKMLEWSK